MLDSIYHMTLRLLLNLISGVKKISFCHYVRNVIMDIIMIYYVSRKSINRLWYIDFIV